MAMKPFRHVERARPMRSVFDLSHYKLFDCDLGQLIPILNKRMVPGDHFRISNEIVVRANPMIAPILHEINCYVHYFFVPLRLLWPKPSLDGSSQEPGSWEDFFTGGQEGDLNPVKPKWITTKVGVDNVHSLWDYFGFPYTSAVDQSGRGLYPDPWYLRAYNFIYNEYYRDQNYMDEVDFDDEELKVRCWEKDYFTTALPWQQRGTAPALPITGFTNAEFLGNIGVSQNPIPNGGITGTLFQENVTGPILSNYLPSPNPDVDSIRSWFNNNRVDLANASTFDVNDLRLAFATQKFLERSARGGGRYVERLKAHYGTSPRDDRLQRPEYIGGTRAPIIVSEVLQTSSTDGTSPQGNLAGHGMSVSRARAASYYAQEFGVVMGIMSLMPRPVYQDGLPREMLGESRYDELLPEFVGLGEQPIYNAEVKWSGQESVNRRVFGFNGRYDEYRVAHNVVCGLMKNRVDGSLAFWHLARSFDVYNPSLNKEFLECRPRKDYLAVPSQPGWIVHFGNIIRAVRPLPVIGIPRGV